MTPTRASNEIAHGRQLAAAGADAVWGWASAAGQARARRRAAWIAQAAQLSAGARVLELGCGTGLFTQHFAATGADITAIDISDELIGVARQRGLPANVHLLCTSFERYAPDAPFDAVIGSSILHHLELRPALTRMVKVLRPGGVIGFGEPNMLNPQIAAQKNLPWVRRRAGDSADETAFVRYQLRAAVEAAGFTEVSITPRDWLHPRTPSMMISAVQRLEPVLESLPLLREFAGSLYIVARKPVH
ncbi:MAG: class I SAM-dependent methyltransferase [Gemmatimonadota bacterium]|nr:class I SAM-dependent methyltransferase [Gemmatimonadota bacterium]